MNSSLLRNSVVLLFAVWVVVYATEAGSKPVASYQGNGMSITLYDDECTLKAEVSNLHHRSTWTEKGKTFEGCWSAHPNGFVVIYSIDKSVVVVPARVFERVTGA